MRIRAMELASDLGMMFMTHVGDPDTWFATKYTDSSIYGTKLSQYEPLEELLDRFRQPWIAAHFGGWPENLEFLDGLLSRHDQLHLDTSATNWVSREISKHEPAELADGRWYEADPATFLVATSQRRGGVSGPRPPTAYRPSALQ
jgi:hypothetical protein